MASDGDRALPAEQRVVVARHPLVAHHLTNGAWSAEEGAAEVLACARARHAGQDSDFVLNKGRKPRKRHSRGAGRSPRASQGAARLRRRRLRRRRPLAKAPLAHVLSEAGGGLGCRALLPCAILRSIKRWPRGQMVTCFSFGFLRPKIRD